MAAVVAGKRLWRATNDKRPATAPWACLPLEVFPLLFGLFSSIFNNMELGRSWVRLQLGLMLVSHGFFAGLETGMHFGHCWNALFWLPFWTVLNVRNMICNFKPCCWAYFESTFHVYWAPKRQFYNQRRWNTDHVRAKVLPSAPLVSCGLFFQTVLGGGLTP